MKTNNPPKAAQILYGFAVTGLFISFFLACIMLLFINSSSNTLHNLAVLAFSTITVYNISTQLAAIILIIISIILFIFVRAIHSSKRWALTAYTVAVTACFIVALFGWFVARKHQSLQVIENSYAIIIFLPYIIAFPLMSILWLKNRADFQ